MSDSVTSGTPVREIDDMFDHTIGRQKYITSKRLLCQPAGRAWQFGWLRYTRREGSPLGYLLARFGPPNSPRRGWIQLRALKVGDVFAMFGVGPHTATRDAEPAHYWTRMFDQQLFIPSEKVYIHARGLGGCMEGWTWIGILEWSSTAEVRKAIL